MVNSMNTKKEVKHTNSFAQVVIKKRCAIDYILKS